MGGEGSSASSGPWPTPGAQDHTLDFGELDGERTPRVEAIAAAFAKAGFDGRASNAILQAMWERWVLIATLASLTTLMRAPVGDIVQAGAEEIGLTLLQDCSRIAAHNGHPPGAPTLVRTHATLTAADSGRHSVCDPAMGLADRF